MPKWKPSDTKIQTVDELLEAANKKQVCFVRRFFQGRPVSAKVIVNMSFSVVMRLLDYGSISIAEQRGGGEE